MLRLALLLALCATPALAQSYVIFPDQPTCEARSQAQCTAKGCDGVHTVDWSACVGPLSAGTAGSQTVTAGAYAMRIDSDGSAVTNPSDPYPAGLSSEEQAADVAADQLAPLLPSDPTGPR